MRFMIRLTAYSLLLKSCLSFRSCRGAHGGSFGTCKGGTALELCDTWSMKTVFRKPFSFSVTKFSCKLMMQKEPDARD